MEIKRKIAHIGIAVENLEESFQFYKDLFQLEHWHDELVDDQKVKTRFIEVGESHFELLEATSPDSPIAKFIEKQGRGGIHHICVEVEDIRNELKRMENLGYLLIDKEPRKGAHNCLVAFVHPKSAKGVLLELSQRM